MVKPNPLGCANKNQLTTELLHLAHICFLKLSASAASQLVLLSGLAPWTVLTPSFHPKGRGHSFHLKGEVGWVQATGQVTSPTCKVCLSTSLLSFLSGLENLEICLEIRFWRSVSFTGGQFCPLGDIQQCQKTL